MTDDHRAAREYDDEQVEAIAQHFRTIVLAGIDPNRWPFEAQARRLIDFLDAAGYEITRRDPAAGRVCVEALLLKQTADLLKRLGYYGAADRLLDELTEATTG